MLLGAEAECQCKDFNSYAAIQKAAIVVRVLLEYQSRY